MCDSWHNSNKIKTLFVVNHHSYLFWNKVWWGKGRGFVSYDTAAVGNVVFGGEQHESCALVQSAAVIWSEPHAVIVKALRDKTDPRAVVPVHSSFQHVWVLNPSAGSLTVPLWRPTNTSSDNSVRVSDTHQHYLVIINDYEMQLRSSPHLVNELLYDLAQNLKLKSRNQLITELLASVRLLSTTTASYANISHQLMLARICCVCICVVRFIKNEQNIFMRWNSSGLEPCRVVRVDVCWSCELDVLIQQTGSDTEWQVGTVQWCHMGAGNHWISCLANLQNRLYSEPPPAYYGPTEYAVCSTYWGQSPTEACAIRPPLVELLHSKSVEPNVQFACCDHSTAVHCGTQ